MIPDRNDVDRRTVLRASGAALTASVVGFAGCAEPEDGGGGNGEDPIDDTPTDGGETTPTPTPMDEDTETPTPMDEDTETPTPTPFDEDTETPTPTPEDGDE